ncbi:vitamin K epoxide reductase family protein [Candidatus Gottesmanbacteria bacterium]|nr:vitamin K epoxide reductase family protein [Candidatus Gottesmanbacteria bacterium]
MKQMLVSEVQTKKLNRIIFILSLVGIVIAIYVFQSFVRQAPIVCVNTGCETVRKSPSSYLFGFPVPGVGLIGYSIIAILSFLRTTKSNNNFQFLKGILGMSIFGVFFVSWFTYTELFVIRAVCTWCAVSAVNMVTIFLLTLKSYTLEKI